MKPERIDGPCTVTVAMTTYNQSRYVRQAISSVLQSRDERLELLISDDASTDDTWSIVQRCCDPRIRTMRASRNSGEYANRNLLLEQARGTYIIYIDGDDLLYADGLARAVETLERFPEAGAALSRPWSEHFIYPALLSPRVFYQCQFGGLDVLALNFAHIVFRTGALRHCGGFRTDVCTGDREVQIRMGRSYPLLLVREVPGWWRRRPQQASEVVLRDHLGELEAVDYERRTLLAPDCPLSPPERARALDVVYTSFLRLVVRQLIRRRVSHALRLLAASGIPARTWPLAIRRRTAFDPVTVDVSMPHSSWSDVQPC